MGLDAVLSTLRSQINTAINTAGITQPGQVIKGWPTAPQLVEILGQPNNEWQVSIYPLRGKDETRYIGEGGVVVTPPVVNLTRMIAGRVLTFAGTITSPLYVHAFLTRNNADAAVPATTTPNDVAAAVAAAVNALAIAGVSAVASGPSVTLTGDTWSFCNIVGTGTISLGEVLRTSRHVQVSVWTTGGTLVGEPDSTLRFAIYDAIVSRIGTTRNHNILLPDGSYAYVAYVGDSPNDDSQSSYSLYSVHIMLYVEYGVFLSNPATQVGDIVGTGSVNGQTADTQNIGGVS